MKRFLVFVYGVVAYLAFLLAFLWAVAFVADLEIPWTVDSGGSGPVGLRLLVDGLLLSVFALQHSLMARRPFKRWIARRVPAAAERSTFVLATSLVLALVFGQWRAVPEVLWEVDGPIGAGLLWGLHAFGWATVLFGTFMISHAHLFGLRQAWDHLRGRAPQSPPFQTRWLYRFVRHPLMLGFLIAFWAIPRMTWGHAFFAAVSTGYILVATLAFEEPDLERYLGEPYRRYQRRVPAFLPRWGRSVPAGRGDEIAASS